MRTATRLASIATGFGGRSGKCHIPGPRLIVEALERRDLLAPLLANPMPVNLSQNPAGKTASEGTIAIDPAAPGRLFAAWNITNAPQHIEGRYSSNGGSTWQVSTLPTNPTPAFDPWAAFDQFGNLFFSYLYLSAGTQYLAVALSTDFGRTFTNANVSRFTNFPGADRPSIATGPGGIQALSQVVVSWSAQPAYGINASAAAINQFNDTVSFTTPIQATPANALNQSVAVGPDGTVMVAWQTTQNPQGPSSIYVSTAPALFALGFGAPSKITDLNVGIMTPLGTPGPLYNNNRGVATVAQLAWDRSGGAHNARVDVTYTDSPAVGSANTNIFGAFSDNNGGNWTTGNNGNPLNDDGGTKSQFLPQMALDQTTGNIAAAWYDARNSATNKLVEIFASVSTDGGQTWKTNGVRTNGPSDATAARATNNFGDYNAMDAYGGNFFPIWADNSGGLTPASNNLPKFDMATIKTPFAQFGAAPPPAGAIPGNRKGPRGTELALIYETKRRSSFATAPSANAPQGQLPEATPTALITLRPPDVAAADRVFSLVSDDLRRGIVSSSEQRGEASRNDWHVELTDPLFA